MTDLEELERLARALGDGCDDWALDRKPAIAGCDDPDFCYWDVYPVHKDDPPLATVTVHGGERMAEYLGAVSPVRVLALVQEVRGLRVAEANARAFAKQSDRDLSILVAANIRLEGARDRALRRVALATGRDFVPPERATDPDVVVDAVATLLSERDAALARVRELEAQAAVMREALEHAREEVNAAYGEYDTNIDDALAPDAGRALLARLEAETAAARHSVRLTASGVLECRTCGCDSDDADTYCPALAAYQAAGKERGR